MPSSDKAIAHARSAAQTERIDKDSSPESAARIALMDELYRRYHGSTGSLRGRRRNLRFLRKKYSWLAVVGGARVFKRLVDILAAGAGLLVLSPLFLLVALAIKCTDGGPVFYCQKRVGQWGREFLFPKFRSMYVDADKRWSELAAANDHAESITLKIKNDPRVTPVGRIIRRLSIDELPQLWCVLKGDMTLVGPRPALPKEVAQYTLEDRRRLDAVPGLTCFWQVEGRGDIPFDQQLQLDVQYIESHSLWVDLKLLLKTIPAVFTGRGAY